MELLTLGKAPLASSLASSLDNENNPIVAINTGYGDSNVLEGSMELLTLGTTPLASPLDNENNPNADDIDIWGGDEVLNYTADDGSSLSSVADREWNRRCEEFHTLGFRNGILAGKQASAQEGFNVGFAQAACSGFNQGLVRGMSSMYANLPERLKEKLRVTLNKKMHQNLHLSAQMVSTSDALNIFCRSVMQAETKEVHSDNTSHSVGGLPIQGA